MTHNSFVSIRIADFGLAYQLNEDKKTSFVLVSPFGTRLYMAPECLSAHLSHNRPIYGDLFALDIWAFGVTIYEVSWTFFF